MSDDVKQDDNQTDDKDSKLTGEKYNAGLYDDNPQKDYIKKSDLNDENAPADEGLGDDASGTYDIDDSTLPAENDSDETETGMDEVDADNLEGQEKMGDVVVD